MKFTGLFVLLPEAYDSNLVLILQQFILCLLSFEFRHRLTFLTKFQLSCIVQLFYFAFLCFLLYSFLLDRPHYIFFKETLNIWLFLDVCQLVCRDLFCRCLHFIDREFIVSKAKSPHRKYLDCDQFALFVWIRIWDALMKLTT